MCVACIAQAAYQEQWVVELKPALYGFLDLSCLLRALPHVATVSGRHKAKFGQVCRGL